MKALTGPGSRKSSIREWNLSHQEAIPLRLTKTDRVLYSPVSTLSQILVDLAPGATYILQYHYRLYKVSNNEGTEMLTASIGGQLVDTLSVTDLTPLVPYYVSRRATYVATADTATLLFEVAGTTLVSFVLDDITLTVV